MPSDSVSHCNNCGAPFCPFCDDDFVHRCIVCNDEFCDDCGGDEERCVDCVATEKEPDSEAEDDEKDDLRQK